MQRRALSAWRAVRVRVRVGVRVRVRVRVCHWPVCMSAKNWSAETPYGANWLGLGVGLGLGLGLVGQG